MSEWTEALDTLFNGRPARKPDAVQKMEQIIGEQRVQIAALKSLIRGSHDSRTPPCQCWVCSPPKSASSARDREGADHGG